MSQQQIMKDHAYVFQKIDDAIYKCIKANLGDIPQFATSGHVIMAMNDDDVALVDKDGNLYYSNHANYGFVETKIS